MTTRSIKIYEHNGRFCQLWAIGGLTIVLVTPHILLVEINVYKIHHIQRQLHSLTATRPRRTWNQDTILPKQAHDTVEDHKTTIIGPTKRPSYLDQP
jgi:hypothetical protein